MKTQKLIKKGIAGRPDLTYERKSPYGDGGFAIYGVRGVTRGDSYLNVYYDEEGNFVKATRTEGGKTRPVPTGSKPLFFKKLGKMELSNPREDALDAMYVEYLRPMQDEEPFMMGGTKYEFVRARYPDGRIDIGVYSTAGDVTYGYRHWRKMMNLDRTATNPINRFDKTLQRYHGGDDPSRQEMIEHIKGVYGREADRFDVEEAIYWFANDYHGGQGSNLYSALSTSEYRPGRSSSGPEEGSMAEMIYSDLVDTFSSKKNPVRPRKGEPSRAFISRCMSEEKMSFPEPKQRIAVCLSKSRKRNPVYDTGSDE